MKLREGVERLGQRKRSRDRHTDVQMERQNLYRKRKMIRGRRIRESGIKRK